MHCNLEENKIRSGGLETNQLFSSSTLESPEILNFDDSKIQHVSRLIKWRQYTDGSLKEIESLLMSGHGKHAILFPCIIYSSRSL